MLLLEYHEMVIENTWNEQYKIFISHILKHVQQMCTKVYPQDNTTKFLSIELHFTVIP